MVKLKIVWSHRARIKLYEILQFYIDRNKSKRYSEKLYARFSRELKLLIKHPDLGKKTEIEGVRGLIIGNYIIFYECTDNLIIVHTLWDCSQNPIELIIK
ncbi:MAG: type II toxin-antitoxin system RelE/ParE family toxin [Bacteroidales bacterium]|nr:type II toxin-antitoxin system RelE/ParE family toxin [Bacteroidales bacterium]